MRGSPKGSLRAFGGSEQSDAPTVYGAVVRAPYKGAHRANFTHRRANTVRPYGEVVFFAILLKLKSIFALDENVPKNLYY